LEKVVFGVTKGEMVAFFLKKPFGDVVGLEVETCGYSEVMYLYFVLCCAVMAEQHLDGFVGLLGESFVGSSDSELGSMAFYIKQMEPKTLRWDNWEKIEEEQCRSAGHCSLYSIFMLHNII